MIDQDSREPPAEPGTRSIPPRVWLLGWISFFADVSSELVYPVLPLFLKFSLGAPASALGIVEGLSSATANVLKGWSGWHSDRTGARVPYVRFGYGLSALAKPLLALASGWGLVTVARVTDRVGKGVRTSARDAMLADTTDPSTRGRAFGLHRALDSAGAVVGVLLALGLLAALPGQYRSIFLIAALPGAASVLLAFRLTEKLKPSEPRPSVPLKQLVRTLDSRYWRALALASVFGLANSSDTFLLLRGSESGMSDLQVILAYALYNVVYSSLSLPGGALSDRIGRWRLIGAGWLLYAAIYAGFAFQVGGWIWVLFALYGVYMGLTDGVTKALAADCAPQAVRGAALGLFHMVSGLAALVSSVATGLIWTAISPEAAFAFCSAMAFASVLLIPITRSLSATRSNTEV